LFKDSLLFGGAAGRAGHERYFRPNALFANRTGRVSVTEIDHDIAVCDLLIERVAEVHCRDD
jgi:hypothetical protein